jgi:hypothetical protein
MILFSGDDNGVLIFGMAVDDPLDFSHVGTGGVQDLDPRLLDLSSLLGADPMRPDDQGFSVLARVTPLVDILLLHGLNSLSLQDFQNLRVVD